MKCIIKRFDDLTIYELYDVMRLRFEVFVIEQSCLYPEIDGKDQQAYHLMCKDDEGELLGYLRILDAGVSYAETSIGRVVVKEKARGLNLGKKIMTEAISFIKTVRHIEAIRISAQAYLLEFYKSLGFEAVSDEYLEDDIPHIEMLLKL
ncbi:GNAT family N-acetyltransferase [Fusibacter ferrireducens]|uniref:GNAT family N-acetyltransferase n=1 Tax=Fusibacter ferrireducens TaxID=2785058 RepID=A0ABR9ZS79_9FIRM|nr:GNAT family N-acetyltransferase [Fusibacter ferrireducens]MBF4693313.1 GNAT family N-acetyltransferase [Fusibacter ferrireducens]